MKKTLLALATSCMFALSAIYFTACDTTEPDPCAKVECGPHGACNNGTCDCAPGYEKDVNGRCDLLITDKLTGKYNGEDFDTKGASVTKYTSAIEVLPNVLGKVTITNLGNYECKNTATGTSLEYKVEATVTGDSVSINSKTCNNLFVGKGYYDKTTKTLTLNYTATYTPDPTKPAVTDKNKAVLKKQ